MANNDSRKNSGMSFVTAGIILLTAAACLFAFNMIMQNTAQSAADEALAEIVSIRPEPREIVNGVYKDTADEPVEYEVPDFLLDPGMDMPVIEAGGRSYVGTLSIPSLGVELPVSDECEKDDLRRSPCRYSGSAYTSDMMICALNYRDYFGGLKELSQGDEVSFIDMTGNIFVYRVTETEVIHPDNTGAINDGSWDLTLFTCTFGGKSSLTVRCEKVE